VLGTREEWAAPAAEKSRNWNAREKAVHAHPANFFMEMPGARALFATLQKK
jgi:hypothetical protein